MMNHVVFANPDNAEARALQADALEQLGYQAESATWRNAYLWARWSCAAGRRRPADTSGPDVVRGMTNELLFDFIALRLNHEKTDGLKAAIRWCSPTSTRAGRWSCRTRCSTTPRAAC